jgi:hypothetical protein
MGGLAALDAKETGNGKTDEPIFAAVIPLGAAL